MTKLAMDDPELSPSLALFEATRTFNEREHVRGYSPIQHALGRSPDPCDRLFPTSMSECPELLVENATEQRLLRAQNSEARALQTFEPGDLVYIWTQQVSGRSSVKGGAFVGPARLLAIEQSTSPDGTRKTGNGGLLQQSRRASTPQTVFAGMQTQQQ